MSANLSTPFAEWLGVGTPPGRTVEVDAVVIGSGYGGAVAALRLAEQGWNVLVLERGAEFQPGDFPNHVGLIPKYLRAQGPNGTVGNLGGLFDFRLGLGMGSLVANGLGGGSLINAGVMMRPDEDVFAQPEWPAEIRHGLDERRQDARAQGLGLSSAYERAATMLGGEVFDDTVRPPGLPPVAPRAPGAPIPVSQLPKAQALRRMGGALKSALVTGNDANPDNALDFEAHPARVTIDLRQCTRCGDCFTGCNNGGAKKTLLTTYLQQARDLGATLLTSALAYTLEPEDPAQRGTPDMRWLVRVLPADKELDTLKLDDAVRRNAHTLRARLVVVAAGTYGSTELLMRSQKHSEAFTLSPALGTRVSGNGDSLSVVADLDEPVEGVGNGIDNQPPRQVGPTITSLLDLRQRRPLDQRIVIQEGATPGALGQVYQELIATAWTLHHLGSWGRKPRANEGAEPLAASKALARHTQMLLAMGHDGSRGRLVWLDSMNGVVPYWVNVANEPVFKRQQQLFDAAQKQGGGVHLHAPTWQLVRPELDAAADGELPPATMLSVHPLGGCPMGDRYETGVVNHAGQVWSGPHAVWDDLYVLDGSIVPTSLGCNPLWTITALAERAMALRGAESAPPPPRQRLPVPAGRAPQAPSRREAPAIDLEMLERLELRDLKLRGALRRSMGDRAESDIQLSMRSADWVRAWEEPKHRIAPVTGTLRLVDPSDPRQRNRPLPHPPLPKRKLEYGVRDGYVDLFSARAGLWDTIRRVLRMPRVFITWFVLRGLRDMLEKKRPGSATPKPWTMLKLFWQATEVRHVRYELEMELEAQDGLQAPPPPRLWLKGDKTVTYAASWWEILRHAWKWLFPPANRLLAVRPGDIRASLLHQLTEPVIRLDASRAQRLLPAPFSEAHARYAFDLQQALQRTPLRVNGGSDSTLAALAASAYPAFLVRYLLQARVLEFRLPTYSDDPLPDAATTFDVDLRAGPLGVMHPREFTLEVPAGLSSSDDGTERPGDSRIRLRLWRYARQDAQGRSESPTWDEGTWCGLPVRRAKTVVLMHAFDMSGHAYTFKTTERNYAEHLYRQGWEVWVLDSRMSPRTAAAIDPCTVDQLGFIDAPRAVDFILDTLRSELGEGDKLQIFGFGQCMGAASLLIGLLGGRLSYDVRASGAQYESATGERPLMPKLAGLVTSQTHPFIVGSRTAQSKTWVPALLRDYAGRAMVPLGVRGPVKSIVESLTDRLFAGFPVPEGERCHHEGALHRIDDDCATCRRIRFLLGGMFRHAHLNDATHRELPKLFGAGSVRLFAQGAKFFEYERLCSEDGYNVYATDETIGRHLALPIRFMHGELNDLFDKESATRSAQQYRRIHPGWSDRYGLGPDQDRWVCDVIDGYGHVDVLIGERAMHPDGKARKPAVYDRLAALLNEAWQQKHAAPASGLPAKRALVARFPRSGPFLGPVVHDNGRRYVGISFIVDDSNTDLPTGAVALVSPHGASGTPVAVPLDLHGIQVAVPARDGRYDVPRHDALVGLRVAHGRIDVTHVPATQGLRVRCVSYTETSPGPMLAPAPSGAFVSQVLPTLKELEKAIRNAHKEVATLKKAADRPFPPTLSQKLRYPRQHYAMRAQLAGHVLAEPRPDAVVRVAVGCCRYTGFPFERDRADAAYERLLAITRASHGTEQPELLFMLGDQIYADRTAGLVDALSPTERFLFRHHEAFTTRATRKLFSSLPTVCVPDDHEFVDRYPLGRPLLRRAPEASPAASAQADQREREARNIAMRAIAAYQQAQLPATAWQKGYVEFRRGRVRFFMLDTRCWRHRSADGVVHTLRRVARKAFAEWVRDCANEPDTLAVLATGSVILPGLYPGSDPANSGPPDTLQGAPEERAWILGELATHLCGRFVLLSGDYHVSFAGEVCLDGQRVGAAVVAPPFYAPMIYTNARPQDLWLGEKIQTIAGEVTVQAVDQAGPMTGSGFGMLSFLPPADGRGWAIRLRDELLDFESDGRWFAVAWPDIALAPCEPRQGARRTVVEDEA